MAVHNAVHINIARKSGQNSMIMAAHLLSWLWEHRSASNASCKQEIYHQEVCRHKAAHLWETSTTTRGHHLHATQQRDAHSVPASARCPIAGIYAPS